MENNFEKVVRVENALDYDAAALVPGLDAAVGTAWGESSPSSSGR